MILRQVSVLMDYNDDIRQVSVLMDYNDDFKTG